VPPESIAALAEAHRLIYRAKVGLERARDLLKVDGYLVPEVLHLLDFVQTQQTGSHGRGRQRRKAA
jgi:UDP-N-acetylglucosamine acyltransferase